MAFTAVNRDPIRDAAVESGLATLTPIRDASAEVGLEEELTLTSNESIATPLPSASQVVVSVTQSTVSELETIAKAAGEEFQGLQSSWAEQSQYIARLRQEHGEATRLLEEKVQEHGEATRLLEEKRQAGLNAYRAAKVARESFEETEISEFLQLAINLSLTYLKYLNFSF